MSRSYILNRYADLIARSCEPCPLCSGDEMVLGVLYLGPKTFDEIKESLPNLSPSYLCRRCHNLIELNLITREALVRPHHGGRPSHRYAITRSGIEMENHMAERAEHYKNALVGQCQ